MSHSRASSLYDHFDHCFVVFKDVQQSFLTRRNDVWGNKINIAQINHSMKFLSFWSVRFRTHQTEKTGGIGWTRWSHSPRVKLPFVKMFEDTPKISSDCSKYRLFQISRTSALKWDVSLYFWINCLSNSFPWTQMFQCRRHKHSPNHRTFVNVLHWIFWRTVQHFAIGHSLCSGMNVILEKGPILWRCQSPYQYRWPTR